MGNINMDDGDKYGRVDNDDKYGRVDKYCLNHDHQGCKNNNKKDDGDKYGRIDKNNNKDDGLGDKYGRIDKNTNTDPTIKDVETWNVWKTGTVDFNVHIDKYGKMLGLYMHCMLK